MQDQAPFISLDSGTSHHDFSRNNSPRSSVTVIPTTALKRHIKLQLNHDRGEKWDLTAEGGEEGMFSHVLQAGGNKGGQWASWWSATTHLSTYISFMTQRIQSHVNQVSSCLHHRNLKCITMTLYVQLITWGCNSIFIQILSCEINKMYCFWMIRLIVWGKNFKRKVFVSQ